MRPDELADVVEDVAKRLKALPWSPSVEEAFDRLAQELRRRDLSE